VWFSGGWLGLPVCYPEGVASLHPRVGRRRPTLGKGIKEIIFNPERVEARKQYSPSGFNPFRVAKILMKIVRSYLSRGSSRTRNPGLEAFNPVGVHL
jgi:hypothetical protein